MKRIGNMSKPDYINQPWYLSEQPWFPSQCAGLMILAGSADGNVGQVIADQSTLCAISEGNEHMPNDDDLRATAKHIVEIHNIWLSGNLQDKASGDGFYPCCYDCGVGSNVTMSTKGRPLCLDCDPARGWSPK